MPRARTDQFMQTAAAPEEASGCFSFMVVPPVAVLFVSVILAALAWRQPIIAHPETVSQSTNIQAEASPTPSLDIQTGQATSQNIVDSLIHPSKISPIFRPEVQYWSNSISQWAAAVNVDPNLAAVIMQIESCGDPRATSRSGAMGLFQVMPFHFYSSDSPYDPDTNAARGLAYLARSLTAAGGDARLAMAGYNGGIGVIKRGEWAWPAQTKRYVYYGAPIYEDARSGVASSSMLDEWYNKYGASLCRQAHNRLGIP
jgi:Transglycosylase SLT domain